MTLTMRVRFVVTLACAAFLSWLVTFSFECYYRSPGKSRQSHPRDSIPPFPGASRDNVFWFLQVSDIHVSIFNELAVVEDFASFCSETVSVVQPSLVLVTGDLTHAKYADERRSRQFEEEWQAYADVLHRTGVQERVPWLDIRGNHDAFDVAGVSHSSNHFRHYGRSWKDHPSYSFSFSHHTPFGSYAFLALDACPHPGPRRPYNFFGILHQEDLQVLQPLVEDVKLHNHSIWFSHYPSCTITTNHQALRRLMSGSVAHLCGHLHNVGGFIEHAYGLHPGGHLELELVDFKDNRRIRLLAFDHDLFSFTDARLNTWPLVLITNPKDARFIVPGREPVGRMKESSHVRLLAFSPSPIASVIVIVDGVRVGEEPLPNKGPLYAFPWQPEKYALGLHTISAVVKDSTGRETVVNQTFSLDGTVSPLERLPQLIVLTDFKSLFQMMFFFMWLSLLASLFMAWIGSNKQVSSTSYFLPLVRTRSVFYPLLSAIVYFGVGPWFVGELLTGVPGLVFVHGVYVSGHFLPGSLTYLMGLLSMCLFYIPLSCLLSHLLSNSDNGQLTLRSLLWFCLFLLGLLSQLMFIRSDKVYGPFAVILSPGVTWPTILSPVLVYMALRRKYMLSHRARLCVLVAALGIVFSIGIMLINS